MLTGSRMNVLDERLNKILDKVTSDDFLKGRGLGNEIPFYAFDYSPQHEEQVREHIHFLLSQINKQRPELKVVHINLLQLLVDYIKDQGFYNEVLAMQQEMGDAALLKELEAPLSAENIANYLVEKINVATCSMIFISGVGSAYPLIRTHGLLNNLHRHMGLTPLVLFYPGKYDGQSLRLFGVLQDNPYYRAFRLVD